MSNILEFQMEMIERGLDKSNIWIYNDWKCSHTDERHQSSDVGSQPIQSRINTKIFTFRNIIVEPQKAKDKGDLTAVREKR